MIRTRDTLLRYAVFPGLWFKPTHPTLQCCYSSPSEIRTHTEQVLNLLPLPIGLPDRGGIISPNIRSTTLTLTGQAVYQISPDAILAIVLLQGLEPRTLSLRGISSNQLSYRSVKIYFAGPNRLEQFLSVLETDVLPLTLRTHGAHN